MGRGGAIPQPAPGLKKNSYPPQTRLLNLNPVPLGVGRGGYPKKPAPLPSLCIGHKKLNHFKIVVRPMKGQSKIELLDFYSTSKCLDKLIQPMKIFLSPCDTHIKPTSYSQVKPLSSTRNFKLTIKRESPKAISPSLLSLYHVLAYFFFIFIFLWEFSKPKCK